MQNCPATTIEKGYSLYPKMSGRHYSKGISLYSKLSSCHYWKGKILLGRPQSVFPFTKGKIPVGFALKSVIFDYMGWKKRMPHWFSSHTEFISRSKLEVSYTNALANQASLHMFSFSYFNYNSLELARGLYIDASVYYIPVKANQAGIDSLIIHNKTLYLLQMTVSDTHVSVTNCGLSSIPWKGFYQNSTDALSLSSNLARY